MHPHQPCCITPLPTLLKAVDETGDGTLDKNAIEFVNALQRDDAVHQAGGPGSKPDGGKYPSQRASDNKMDRRNTVHHIAANLKEARAKGPNLNLEREFRENLKKISKTNSYFLAHILSAISSDLVHFSRYILVFSSCAPPK